MDLIDQEIALGTEAGYGSNVPLSVSSALLRRLEDTARPCVRMAIQGASASVGTPPGWLERACDIRTVGFSERDGRSILHLKAPTLGDAVPEVFDQQNLWPGMANAEDTAIQLIGRIGQVVQRQEAASDMYDQPLLRHFGLWQRFFTRDVDHLQILASSNLSLNPVTLDIKVVENAKLLNARTPMPRQIRIVGKLDMVRYSTRSFALLLDQGDEVRGVLHEGDPELLQKYWGKEITVLGKAIYRPSGSLLRLDAQEILDTTEGRTAFSRIPDALSRIPRNDKRSQTGKLGVSAFFDTWPGEETDEELLAALGDLRR